MRAPGSNLRPLIAAMEELVPGVRGRIGEPVLGEIAPGADNRAAITALVSGVSARHPEAGAFFWSVRSWGLLEWQASALTVLGVHQLGIAAPVDRVALSVGDGGAYCHALPEAEAMRGCEADLIALAGARLRARADGLLDDLSAVIAVKRTLALRLLADRVLDFVARMTAERSCSTPEMTMARGARWLAAMGLEGASGYVPVSLGDGRVRPALDRRSCCLDYRIADGACCASCPRLSIPERLERMRRTLEDHAVAR